MGSSWAFKITASLIKPTRETLLDYCAYILIIISVVGIARVWIGSEDIKNSCSSLGRNTSNSSLNWTLKLNEKSNVRHSGSASNVDTENFITASNNFQPNKSEEQEPHNESSKALDPKLYEGAEQRNVVQITYPYCSKHYQAYFPYILLVESIILLFTGILWVKMPSVQSLVHQFSALLNESRKASWSKNIPITSESTISSGFTYSLPTMFRQESIEFTSQVHVLLEGLFQSETKYSDKSQARNIYEKIQKFCFENENSQSLWKFYIRKSMVQFIFWIIMFTINMILFVQFEFYIGCESTATFCSHDTFLRIIWFMAQVLVLMYGMFNCATLKWINEKSHSATTMCSMLKFVCGCSWHPDAPDNPEGSKQMPKDFKCIPFSIGHGQRALRNDMALLLHLVSSSNRNKVPYFTLFLCKEWKEKFLEPSSTTLQSVAVPRTYRKPALKKSAKSQSEVFQTSEIEILVNDQQSSTDSEVEPQSTT
ncbi:volume-regulated anion channel subunit LRRC8D-like [Clavelina lepadiformis]|uniref:volume-regulated anion channel subunit LRRC8D-like n=1 Tax=Clavelina lepadiformis TaxID=159417 RepID=UPI0040431A67